MTLRGEEGTERGFPEGAYYFEDLNRMKVAEAIISTEKVKQSFWHTDRYNTCCLKIIAPTFDRQIIFGFFLAFLGNYYQSSTGGGV